MGEQSQLPTDNTCKYFGRIPDEINIQRVAARPQYLNLWRLVGETSKGKTWARLAPSLQEPPRIMKNSKWYFSLGALSGNCYFLYTQNKYILFKFTYFVELYICIMYTYIWECVQITCKVINRNNRVYQNITKEQQQRQAHRREF